MRKGRVDGCSGTEAGVAFGLGWTPLAVMSVMQVLVVPSGALVEEEELWWCQKAVGAGCLPPGPAPTVYMYLVGAEGSSYHWIPLCGWGAGYRGCWGGEPGEWRGMEAGIWCRSMGRGRRRMNNTYSIGACIYRL